LASLLAPNVNILSAEEVMRMFPGLFLSLRADGDNYNYNDVVI
jgi:hypothetical protein